MIFRSAIERLLAGSPTRRLLLRSKAREYSLRFPGARISPQSQIPKGDISIGRGTYGRFEIRLFHPSDRVVIGNYCSIAREVLVLAGGEHRTDTVATYPLRAKLDTYRVNPDVASKGAVEIGSDVWFGVRTTVLSGVEIGNGAIVGACSVVTKDVPPFAVVAGNPARQLRSRFSDDVIEELQRIAWWQWPEDRIKRHTDAFSLPVSEFINRFRPTLEDGCDMRPGS